MADPRHPTVPGAPAKVLVSGQYFVRVKSSGLYLADAEEQPLLPKKVYTLPGGTMAPMVRCHFVVESKKAGIY